MEKTKKLACLLAFGAIFLYGCASTKPSPHTHVWSEWKETKLPTCSEAGAKERECACGEKDTQSIPATGKHVLTKHDGSDATCTDDGTINYWTCNVCGKYFSDANGKQEIGKDETKTHAAGHQFGDWVSSEAEHYKECSVCQTKKDAAEHSFNGKTCTVCGYTLQDAQGLAYEPTKDGSGYVVTGMGTADTAALVIPSTYNEKPVKEIGEGAFAGSGTDGASEKIKIAWIPETVNSIGCSAFKDCIGLTSVIWNAENCTEAGDSWDPVFENCTNLRSVTFGENVKIIPENAFTQCSALERATFGSSVTSIGDFAFYCCENLETAVLPDSVQSIGWRCFEDTGLKCVRIPAACTFIDMNVFDGCDLETIEVDEKNTVYSGAGNNLIRMQDHALLWGSAASVIPSDGTVTYIYGRAFSGRKGLKTITIPSKVTSIDNAAFKESGLESVTIEAGLQEIPTMCFFGCASLTDVTLAESVTVIGMNAFENCTALEHISLPSQLEEIKTEAFMGCAALTKIEIPEKVEWLQVDTFKECSSLAEIVLPRALNCIKRGALANCPLTSATFTGGGNWKAQSYTVGQEDVHFTQSELSDRAAAATYLKQYSNRDWYLEKTDA